MIEQQHLRVVAQPAGGAPDRLWVDGLVRPWVDLGAVFGEGGWQAEQAVWGSASYYVAPPTIVQLPLIVAQPGLKTF
jgi:hypothetical protein